MRPPTVPSVFPELLVVWVVAAAAASAGFGLVAAVSAGVVRTGRWAAQRRRDSAVAAFAAAVVHGDLARAEAEARRAFGASGRPTPAAGLPAAGPAPATGAALAPAIATWDEWVDVDCTLAQVTSRIHGPQDVARWFTAFHRADGPSGTSVVVGRFPLRVSEQWTGTGVSFQAEGTDGSQFRGYLTFRPVLLPGRGSRQGHQGVEVWVHAEAPTSRTCRRVMRTARLATRDGLRLMAANLAR